MGEKNPTIDKGFVVCYTVVFPVTDLERIKND